MKNSAGLGYHRLSRVDKEDNRWNLQAVQAKSPPLTKSESNLEHGAKPEKSEHQSLTPYGKQQFLCPPNIPSIRYQKHYTGADKIVVPNTDLKSGDACPACLKGKVYQISIPKVVVRIVGNAPLKAVVYELERLRCNLCGQVFTAAEPDKIGDEKHDETAGTMIALLKYGSGFPFNRLEGLQGSLGIPLPASTQWDIVEKVGDRVHPAFKELIRQAALGEVIHNDDTTMKILSLMKENDKDESERQGMFTTGILSTLNGRKIALFFTGRKHAGENMNDLLKQRESGLSPPIQMCDALSRNLPKDFESILANCMAHGRRNFVDVTWNFPEECRHVIETLVQVYKNDKIAKDQNTSPEQPQA